MVTQEDFVDLLQRRFTLYQPTDTVIALECYETRWYAYASKGFTVKRKEGCYFEASYNKAARSLYLVTIHIPHSLRGQGYGAQLYNLVEHLARLLNCRYIEQTPAGHTGTGETRLDYLKRRGYHEVDGATVRKYFKEDL